MASTGAVWYGMVWYGMVLYGMVWYGIVCVSQNKIRFAGSLVRWLVGWPAGWCTGGWVSNQQMETLAGTVGVYESESESRSS